MARNRKYRSAAVRFGPALKAFLLCLLIGGSAVGYVWQKNQIYQLGQQKLNLETRYKQVIKHNNKLQNQLQSMRNPKFLEKRIQELGLVAPAQSQIWRLPEPSRDAPKKSAEDQYVAQQNRNAP